MPFPESKCNNVTSSKTPVKFCKTKMEDRGQVKVTANMYSKDAVIFVNLKWLAFTDYLQGSFTCRHENKRKTDPVGLDYLDEMHSVSE